MNLFDRHFRGFALIGLLALASLYAPQAHAQTLKQLQAQINALQSQVTSLTSTVTSQGSAITTLQSTVAAQQTKINQQADTISALQGSIVNLNSAISTLNTTLAGIQTFTQFFSVNGTDLTISGCNLHLVNGSGQTYTANGLGNLFIGYDYQGVVTGSHNLIMGAQNNTNSCAGILVGQQNSISGHDSVILAGFQSHTLGNGDAILGGDHNNLVSNASVEVGGNTNTASDGSDGTVIIGGTNNLCTAQNGGFLNSTFGINNNSYYCTLIGGQSNDFEGGASYSVVCGGVQNRCDGFDVFMGGGESNHASGAQSAMIGGFGNLLDSGGTGAAFGGGQARYLNSPQWFAAGLTAFNP